ncbi:hypothetical protein [Helicobacter typhlonius]
MFYVIRKGGDVDSIYVAILHCPCEVVYGLPFYRYSIVANEPL